MLARKYILPLVAWASRPCIFTLALVLCASALAADEPTVKIGPGGELIVGGFDPSSPDNAAAHAKALDEAIPRLVSLGVTSHEIYVRWNLCEPEEGKWDWSVYDKFFEIYKRHNIKCVPFLICGSAYSLPNWYYKKPGSQGYICLEHNQESDVQSLWNPKMREHVGSFIKAFCDHYRDTGRIESILLGITGNYGEAIYIATGDDWTADVHGKYHTHMGFWAGDEFAIKDFRDWLKKKYKSPEALSKAWGGAPRDFETVKPFLRKNAPNDRAWIDMVDWYVGSMTDYTRFWLAEVRKNFPARAGEIYVCTGGHAPPEHGADFGDQCKAAAEYKAGVRITNEASDYRLNFSITRWVASASRQYGAYFSYEPAGGVDPRGVVARIYNATASGAKGLHYYHGNLFDSPAHTNAFIKSGPNFTQRQPITDIAVYYPSAHIKLHGSLKFLETVKPLRDRFDFAYLSDQQILDGGLKDIKALIITLGTRYERSVLEHITKWQSTGGLVIYPRGIEQVTTVGGRRVEFDKPAAVFRGLPTSLEYREFICSTLKAAKNLSAPTLKMLTLDSREDNVYATVTSPTEILWFNNNDQESPAGDLRLPPLSITAQQINPQ